MSHYRFISMLIGLGVMSACNDPDERRVSAQNDNGSDLSMSVDGGKNGGGKISLSLPSIKLGAPEVDIDGVKLYPGARVTGVDISGQEGQSEGGLIVRFDADVAPDKVRDYYLAAFKSKGVAVTQGGEGISGHDEDGKPFRIMLSDNEGNTRGAIQMGNKAS
jgi:hypothetical protein